jgi:hypothetical protein
MLVSLYYLFYGPNHNSVFIYTILEPYRRSNTNRNYIYPKLNPNLTGIFTLAGTLHPVGKHYPKLRAGTLDSCLKFLMTLYDIILQATFPVLIGAS